MRIPDPKEKNHNCPLRSNHHVFPHPIKGKYHAFVSGVPRLGAELSDLDRTGLMVAMIAAAILLLVGLGLSFHLKLWQALTEIIYDKVHLKLPPPLLCLLTCFAVLGGIYGWLNNHYPADSIIFKDKPWTLGEIKQRLETVSGVDIQLKGDVASFAIDRRISGACAADVLKAICDHYRDQLICRNEPARTIIERKP